MVMSVILIGLIFSSMMLMRIVMMLSGQLKGPMLACFQKYGDLEGHFYPVTEILFWLAWFILFFASTLDHYIKISFPAGSVTIILLVCAYWSNVIREPVQRQMGRWAIYPGWYRRLQEHTTRHERRRIAYMWLRLPLRTRLLYNANTHAFEVWYEMVILATL